LERIHATSFEEVRDDHLMRYLFARDLLVRSGRTKRVLDAGCGIGYGAAILSGAVEHVDCIDLSEEAAEWHHQHFARPNVNFISGDVVNYPYQGPYDAVVCFEFLEHVHEAADAVRAFGKISDTLICSTPNEEVRPHKMPPVNEFHVRHYTPSEFDQLLDNGGYRVCHWFNQISGAQPELRPGTDGKFIIALADKVGEPWSLDGEGN